MRITGLLVALALAVAPLAAGERLTLHVFANGYAPTVVIIQTLVPQAANNRSLAVVAESEDFFRSSTVQLDGERAPRLSNIHFPQVPAGLYKVSATVFDREGHVVATASQWLNIS